MSDELRDTLGLREHRPNFGSEPYAEPYWSRGLDSTYLRPWHMEFRMRVRTFVEEHITPFVDEWENAGRLPRELWAKAGSAGLLAPACTTVGRPWPKESPVPPPCNVDECDHFAAVLAVQELARPGSGGLIYALLVSLHMGLTPVLTFGNEALRNRLVGPCLRGEKIICQSTAEPHAGIDVARVRTTAVRDGDVYVVNGTKMWVTAAAYADYIVTMVQTNPSLPFDEMQRGLSLLVIETNLPGVKLEPLQMTGCVTGGQCMVVLEDVRVPVTNLIGKEGMGFRFINYNSDHCAYLWYVANVAVSLARAVLRECFLYSHQRKVFGERLSQNDSVREKLAAMAAEVESVEGMLEPLTFNFSQHMWGSRASKRLLGRCALAKMKSTKTLEFCGSHGVHLLGAKGLTRGRGRGCLVERLFRDSLCFAIPGGTHEVLAGLAVRQALLYEHQPHRAKL